MFRPRLDAELARVTLRPSLGNWELIDPNRTWVDFEDGRVEAFRAVRRGGKTYWVTATRRTTDPFAAVVHKLLSGKTASSRYTHFNLYRTHPRQPGRPSATNLGGGRTHLIGSAVKEAGWS